MGSKVPSNLARKRRCWILLLVILMIYLAYVWRVNSRMSHQTRLSAHLTDPTNLIPSSKNNNVPHNPHPHPHLIPPLDPNFPLEPNPRPPLDSILQGWNVTGDASWLLNLAIIGFPKTGTSTLMKYLHKSPQILVFDRERCEIEYNQHVRLIQSLYHDMPSGHYLRGIKCPRDLEVPAALRNYQQFFPHTDFLIGLRHPMEWFESFYNFRVHNLFDMPPADQLIGRCQKRHQGVCTFRGNFHLFLANLGKTKIATDEQEQALIPMEYRSAISPIPLQGRVFLWEISQLKSDEELQKSRINININGISNTSNLPPPPHSNAQFREDLRQFLRLDYPLPEMIKVKPGFSHAHNQTAADHVDSRKMNICDTRYTQLRHVLLEQGKLAARWIRDYFLPAPGVYVSQRDYFSQVLLKQWEHDPCESDAGERGKG